MSITETALKIQQIIYYWYIPKQTLSDGQKIKKIN